MSIASTTIACPHYTNSPTFTIDFHSASNYFTGRANLLNAGPYTVFITKPNQAGSPSFTADNFSLSNDAGRIGQCNATTCANDGSDDITAENNANLIVTFDKNDFKTWGTYGFILTSGSPPSNINVLYVGALQVYNAVGVEASPTNLSGTGTTAQSTLTITHITPNDSYSLWWNSSDTVIFNGVISNSGSFTKTGSNADDGTANYTYILTNLSSDLTSKGSDTLCLAQATNMPIFGDLTPFECQVPTSFTYQASQLPPGTTPATSNSNTNEKQLVFPIYPKNSSNLLPCIGASTSPDTSYNPLSRVIKTFASFFSPHNPSNIPNSPNQPNVFASLWNNLTALFTGSYANVGNDQIATVATNQTNYTTNHPAVLAAQSCGGTVNGSCNNDMVCYSSSAAKGNYAPYTDYTCVTPTPQPVNQTSCKSVCKSLVDSTSINTCNIACNQTTVIACQNYCGSLVACKTACTTQVPPSPTIALGTTAQNGACNAPSGSFTGGTCQKQTTCSSWSTGPGNTCASGLVCCKTLIPTPTSTCFQSCINTEYSVSYCNSKCNPSTSTTTTSGSSGNSETVGASNSQPSTEPTCDQIMTAIGGITTDPQGFIRSIFGILLSLSGGVALAIIIYNGYRLLISQGNPEMIKKARENITSGIIGLIFAILSLAILQIIGVNILHIPGFTP
ncbi:MAG TPA: pilin [Patescibacteria group bacterium]|nr:pilin [Patescibacteria group bacterium]